MAKDCADNLACSVDSCDAATGKCAQDMSECYQNNNNCNNDEECINNECKAKAACAKAPKVDGCSCQAIG